jgi:retron-type reverse transcriptase
MKSLCQQVRTKSVLQHAWSVIYANGIRSESANTRSEVADFASDAHREVDRIERKLRGGTFVFPPAVGIAIKKKTGNKKRPIVKSPIPSRIVQRAILDVIQRLPEIKTKLGQHHNFGGIEGVGVPEAIEEAYKASLSHAYFIRSDIKSFFDKIPRDLALEKITSITKEPDFDKLLKKATDTELSNLKQLGRDGELFPLQKIGVAQGSCLSPLLCNLLLEDFDRLMNQRGIICVRYIDDFIIFAKNKEYAFKALSSGRAVLKAMDLDCYDPVSETRKAEHGLCRDGFAFLGCDVHPGRIRPSAKSRKNLLFTLSGLFNESISIVGTPVEAIHKKKTYADTLLSAGNIVRGWGNTYSFCTDDRLMDAVDLQIDEKFRHFNKIFKQAIANTSVQDRRRVLGLFLLADCKKDLAFRKLVDQSAA